MNLSKNDNDTNSVSEPSVKYKGFVHLSEDEKLLEDVFRPDLEKLQLFTKMLRRNATLKKATVVKKIS